MEVNCSALTGTEGGPATLFALSLDGGDCADILPANVTTERRRNLFDLQLILRNKQLLFIYKV